MIDTKEKQIRNLYSLIHNGFNQMAIDVLNQMIMDDPQQPRWLAEKMGLLADTCQWELFYETQGKLITDFPGTAENYLAQALNPGINISSRLESLSKAIDIDPNFPRLYLYRGLTYRDLRSNRQAVAEFTEGLYLEPDNYILYFFRAQAYHACGEYYAAFRDLLAYFLSPLNDSRVPLLDEMILVLTKMKELDLALDQTLKKHNRYWLDDSSGLVEEPIKNAQHLVNKKRGKTTRDETKSMPSNDPDPN